uniref:Uncharacterized protein n=1 Tax=Spongospora subterranea TaxID=70186 RepID=A0A0H5QWB1_9EUKA|eukprot:CRZ06040.1 hypothetical protein [Spongospora subterranea]
MNGGGGLSSVVDRLDCSSMATACITIMPVPICLASCKPHSSLDTWLASAMVSSSCSGLLVSVQPYFLSVIYTGQSSASRKQVRRFSSRTECMLYTGNMVSKKTL